MELLVVMLIIGILAAIIVPNLGMLSGEAGKVRDKRNAQTIVLSYTTGAAAGVQWPDDDVATVVAAVRAGQKPPSGVFSKTVFQATIADDMVAGTYRYLGIRATGGLFFDSTGAQNANGN